MGEHKGWDLKDSSCETIGFLKVLVLFRKTEQYGCWQMMPHGVPSFAGVSTIIYIYIYILIYLYYRYIYIQQARATTTTNYIKNNQKHEKPTTSTTVPTKSHNNNNKSHLTKAQQIRSNASRRLQKQNTRSLTPTAIRIGIFGFGSRDRRIQERLQDPRSARLECASSYTSEL